MPDCYCGKQKLDPEWANDVFQDTPCWSQTCYQLAKAKHGLAPAKQEAHHERR
jgi:hypothetical protein